MDSTTSPPTSELEEMIVKPGEQQQQQQQQQEILSSPTSSRERDLLAIIADKDKRIKQLEERLQSQATFIDSVLKLSDDFKLSSSLSSSGRQAQGLGAPPARARSPPARRGVLRNVSWDKSVEEQQSVGGFWREQQRTYYSKNRTGFNPASTEGEIKVDDVDNLLGDDDDDDDVLVLKKNTKLAAAKTETSSSKTKTKSEAKPETTEDVAIGGKPQVPKKKAKSKVEKRIVQEIIDGLRNDDDSVEC